MMLTVGWAFARKNPFVQSRRAFRTGRVSGFTTACAECADAVIVAKKSNDIGGMFCELLV
jgi:hypothetical protein